MTSAGIEGGKNLAESAQDLERTRKAISVQLAEFDGVKKSLMRDLSNRCEKVLLNLASFRRLDRLNIIYIINIGSRIGDTARRDQGAIQQCHPQQQQQGAAKEDGFLGAQFGATHSRPETSS